ncbi:MAG: MFS transporter [Acidobacteria bacterium]|nr:MFS transporter [Acidobacteriota bacterium]
MGQSDLKKRAASSQRIVLLLLFAATAINYLDRQTLSIIAPILHHQIGLTTIDYSRVVFIFLLGYMISQSLAGKVIDVIGTRLGLFLCVAFWSVVSILHGLVVGVISLAVLRLFLGLAEAGNWPGGVKAVSENFPPERRAFAVGVFNSGSTFGAIIAPPIVAGVAGIWSWRLMFVAIGLTGIVWVVAWHRLYRRPHVIPFQEAAVVADSTARRPFRQFFGERAVWGFMVGRFFADPIWWFYAFWLPEYLAHSRGFSLMQIGATAWIPFLFAGIGGWVGGHASDVLVRHGRPPVTARKIVMVISAILMFSGIPAFEVHSSTWAIVWISVVLFGYTSWASNILSLPADLFPSEEVGQVTGIAGTTAAFGGMLFTLATGWLAQNVSYGSVFVVSTGMIICSAIVIVVVVPRYRHGAPATHSPRG